MINWRNSKYVEGGCSQIGCKSLMLYFNYFSKIKVTPEYSSVSVSVKMIVSSIMKLSIKLSAPQRLTQLSQSLDTSSWFGTDSQQEFSFIMSLDELELAELKQAFKEFDKVSTFFDLQNCEEVKEVDAFH